MDSQRGRIPGMWTGMAGMNAARKQVLYLELVKLVGAGFGIREAASAMLATRLPGPEKHLLEGILDGLGQGRSIAESFGAVTTMERGIIAAGERGGKLGSAFEHLGAYFGLLAGARRDALRALVYPLVLLHLGILLAVIPADLMGVGLTAGGLVGRFLMALLAVYAVIAVLALGVVWLLKRAPRDARIDRLLNRLPVVGTARRNLAMARFTKVFHAGIVAGLSMSETAGLAGEAAHSGAIGAAAGRLVAAAKEGNELGPVMVAETAFPKAFARSYATAEQSGMLDRDLARWATVFEQDAARGVKTLSVVLPKLGYALMVLFVVWKIFGFYGGYYETLEQIGI